MEAQTVAGGLVHGADMIVRGLHQPGDEFALDFTVFSEACVW